MSDTPANTGENKCRDRAVFLCHYDLCSPLGKMSVSARVLAFGVVSGLAWSVIPGVLTHLFNSVGETATVLAAAVVTGVVISFALKAPLAKAGICGCFGLGLLALPLGAFAFGVFCSLAGNLTGGVDHSFGGNPISVGLWYAVLSVVSVFAVILFPLAILTTTLLRDVILFQRKPGR